MKQYFAFISYKRDDQKWAEWLQEKLEHYKLPSNLNGKDNLPKEIRPVFRDKSELAAGVLADEIQKALDNSKYLIVICSPHSAKSQWVNKEVQAFIESGRTDKIIPFIIEGVPNSGNDETECFPKAIRELPAEDELLGVNINEMGRDAAAVKVVAQMFGLRFDDLWQRHEREKKRRRNWIITASVVAFLVMVGIAGWIWHQNTMLKKKDWKMLESQSRFVSEKVYSEISNNPDLVQNIATVILPKDIENPDRPYTAEAERVLRKTFEYKPCIVKSYNNSLYAEARFSEDGTKFLNRRRWDMLHPTLVILDANTGIELQRIESSDYGCADIRIDGKQAIMMNDSIFKIVDVETGAEIRTFDQYKNIETVVYYRDDIVVVFDKQEQLFTINVATGQELDIGYAESVFFDVSPNGQKSFYYDNINGTKTINIVDINSGESNSWIVDEIFVSGILSYDGKLLLTSLERGEMTLWDVETGEKLKTMNLSDGKQTMPLALSPDGKFLATVYMSGMVKIWDVETLNVIDVFEMGGTVTNDIHGTFSSDGKKLAVCSDIIIKIVEIETNETSNVIAKVDGVTDDYNKSDIIMDHNNLIYYNYYEENNYYIFNITKKNGKQRIMKSNEVFWDYNYRFYQTDNYTITICDDASGDTLYSLVSDNIIKDGKRNQDGNLVCFLSYDVVTHNASGEANVDISMFDIETGEKTRHLEKTIAFNGTCIRIGDISCDFNYMALLYGDVVFDTEFLAHGIIIINLVTGEETTNILIDNSLHNRMYLSPDGKCFVTYSDIYMCGDAIYMIGDARSGAKITEIDGVWNQYPFSPDGRHILSNIDHIKYNVYDVTTGNCVHTIERENDTLIAASFTDDGRHIITVSSNGDVCQWDFPPLQDLIDQTRERFKNRPLTEEERKMYYLE